MVSFLGEEIDGLLQADRGEVSIVEVAIPGLVRAINVMSSNLDL